MINERGIKLLVQPDTRKYKQKIQVMNMFKKLNTS